MNDAHDLIDTLRRHLALCQEILALAENENQELRSPETASGTAFNFYQKRRTLLPALDRSLQSLKQHRHWWSRLSSDQRRAYPEAGFLFQANQDLIMKIVVLDRENEQARLRLGLLHPNHVPPASAQRPHYVSGLYRRHQPAAT